MPRARVCGRPRCGAAACGPPWAGAGRREPSSATAAAFVPPRFALLAGGRGRGLRGRLEPRDRGGRRHAHAVRGGTVEVAPMRRCHSRTVGVVRRAHGAGLSAREPGAAAVSPTAVPSAVASSVSATLEGACTRGICDTMKTAVDAAFPRGTGGQEHRGPGASQARGAPTTGALRRWARITWSSPLPARRQQASRASPSRSF